MVLFIDSHLFNIVIIIYENGKTVLKKEIVGEKYQSKVLMPTIKDALDGRIPDSIVVVNGPGSFTGVRLGVTIAKTLAYTLNIPIRTISFLECLAISCNKEKKTVAFNDNNGYYIGRFNGINVIGEFSYLTNMEYAKMKENEIICDNIVVDYEKVISYALKKHNENPHQVNPIYVKKLDVEK